MPAPKNKAGKTKAEEKVLQLVENKKQRESRPASSPEAREAQLVNLAVDLAEKQLRDGTASPSVIAHFLKVASSREAIEREMLKKQYEFLDAKAKSIGESKDAEKLAKAAIEAMKNYNSGS
jgi:hypothetical protein